MKGLGFCTQRVCSLEEKAKKKSDDYDNSLHFLRDFYVPECAKYLCIYYLMYTLYIT